MSYSVVWLTRFLIFAGFGPFSQIRSQIKNKHVLQAAINPNHLQNHDPKMQTTVQHFSAFGECIVSCCSACPILASMFTSLLCTVPVETCN